MSIEKEQFEKVMAELRRACLPAGGADAVQAYVDSLAGDLARAQASAATLGTAGRGAWARANTVEAQLTEAVGLIEKSADLAGELGDYLVSLAKRHSGTELLDQERNLRTFLARQAPTEPSDRTLRSLLQEHAPELAALVEPYKGMTLREGLEAAAESEQEPAPTTTALGQALDAIAAMPRRQPVTGQAEQQEARGAQAVDELEAVAEAIFYADKDNWYSAGPYPQLHANDKARLIAMARAALATRPAVQTQISMKRCATIRVNRLESGRYAPKVMRFDAGQFPDGELVDVYAAVRGAQQ